MGQQEKDLLLQLFLLAALIAVVAGVGQCTVRLECSHVGNISEHESRYEILGGCFIKTKDGWTPLGKWRVVD